MALFSLNIKAATLNPNQEGRSHKTRRAIFPAVKHTCFTDRPVVKHTCFTDGPAVKHTCFTGGLTMIMLQAAQKIGTRVKRALLHHQARASVRRLMNQDAAMLDDIGISRADLVYVLQKRSPIRATIRLQLLSVERRAVLRADQARRAHYLRQIVPAPFNAVPLVAQDKRNQRTSNTL